MSALWNEFKSYLSDQKGRVFRMTSIALGNLDRTTAQRLSEHMRDLLTNTTNNRNPLSLVKAAEATPEDKLAFQDQVLRSLVVPGKHKQAKSVELRVKNPATSEEAGGKSVARTTWQFGPVKTTEEEALLLLLSYFVEQTVAMYRNTMNLPKDTFGASVESNWGVWEYTLWAKDVDVNLNPDEVLNVYCNSSPTPRARPSATLHLVA